MVWKSYRLGGIVWTRLRKKSVYRVVRRLDYAPRTGVTSDQIIELNSAHAIKRGAPRLRRVGYKDAETGHFYQFVTNNFALSASTIAAIYKDRWLVETFFKRSSKIKNTPFRWAFKKRDYDANMDCDDRLFTRFIYALCAKA